MNGVFLAKTVKGARPAFRTVNRVILCGKKIGYAVIRELLGGNTRQGIGPSSAYCRVLPGIAGYCRVVVPWEKSWELMIESRERGHRSAMTLPSEFNASG